MCTTFNLAARPQLAQKLRHLILVQVKRFLYGPMAELHAVEHEEVECGLL